QDLTSIRSAYATGIFGAVERKCVGLDLWAPECRFKTLRETGRFSIKSERIGVTPETLRNTRRLAFGGVDIPLHFGEGDVALSYSSVSVEYRVMRIFAVLIGESLFGCSLIFNESIAVRIAWAIDPVQGRFDGRPQRRDRGIIASTFRIKTSKQNKQRCRINTSIVQAEGHFSQRRHF